MINPDRESAAVGLTGGPVSDLAGYAGVSIAFEVREMLDCDALERDSRSSELPAQPVSPPYVKDYDAIAGEGPSSWAERFDLTGWHLLVARAAGARVGGAVVAHAPEFDVPSRSVRGRDMRGRDMLRGHPDLAVLWDIRVAPAARGQGIGAVLLDAATTWAAARGCRRMEVETQNVNLSACRFYARHGFTLDAIERSAYPALPHEIRLTWGKELADATPADVRHREEPSHGT